MPRDFALISDSDRRKRYFLVHDVLATSSELAVMALSISFYGGIMLARGCWLVEKQVLRI